MLLEVKHWRERYRELAERYENVLAVHDVIEAEDEYFKGARGYIKMLGIATGRGGLGVTLRVVQILERVRRTAMPKVEDRDLINTAGQQA